MALALYGYKRIHSSHCISRRSRGSIQSKIFATTSIATPSQKGPSSSTSQRSFLSFLWHAYCQALDHSPLLTKAACASAIFALSDTATQTITIIQHKQNHKHHSPLDGQRILSAATFGVVATTWLHYWWNALEVLVHKRIVRNHHRLANTIAKVTIDQGIGAPIYIYTYYVLTNFGQKAKTIETAPTVWQSVNQKAQDMLWPTMTQHWKLWPIVHTINFYFTPLHHRVLVQNAVLIFWSGYLSHLNHYYSSTTTTPVKDPGDTCCKLMTPEEEINSAIVRRDSVRVLEQ